MAHEAIPIPGSGTGVSAGATITFAGFADEDQTLTLTYNARSTHLSPRSCGVLTFSGVVELRSVEFWSSMLLPNSKDYAFTLQNYGFGRDRTYTLGATIPGVDA